MDDNNVSVANLVTLPSILSFLGFDVLLLAEKIVVILQTITTSTQHLWVLSELPPVFSGKETCFFQNKNKLRYSHKDRESLKKIGYIS